MIAYYPKVLKVKAGTTVTFVNKSASEVHNIVFGPKKYVEQWGKTDRHAPCGPRRRIRRRRSSPTGPTRSRSRTRGRRRTATA